MTSSVLLFVQYADDSTMSATGSSVAEISEILTENCRKVSDWMIRNRFKLDADKTHLLTVGTAERLRITDTLNVHMDGLAKGGLAGSLSGPGTGLPRVGARALKVKKLIALNKIPPLSSGSKRKYDYIRSGSR